MSVAIDEKGNLLFPEGMENSGNFKLPDGWFEFTIKIENLKNKELGIECERESKACIKLSEINGFYNTTINDDVTTTLLFKSGDTMVVQYDIEFVKQLIAAQYANS